MGEVGGVNWWLIIEAPGDNIYAWEVWPNGEPPDETIINAARVAVGFPADDRWVTDGSGWDVQLTLDRPHDKLMARATAGALDDLRKIDPAAVQEHADARAEAARVVDTTDLRARLAELDEATLAEVLRSLRT